MADQETLTGEHAFEASVSEVLSLVINSLYSNDEIFLRELISNASDALDKARFRATTEEGLLGDDTELRVRLIPDPEANTLTIEDNGVGMTDAELVQNLGTIAHSGSRAFIAQLKEAAEAAADGAEPSLIGQFGVGFYSAFLVADRVDVVTRSVDSDRAWRWSSDGVSAYTIEEAERAGRGTAITLHLKEDAVGYAQTWRLRQLVERYSDYVEHRIEAPAPPPAPADDEEAPEEAPEVVFEQINEGSALWRRSSDELDDEQYEAFYRHLTHDWQAPLGRTHFKMEGMQQFTGLIFVPGQAPFDLYDPEGDHGIKLYVRRVFIMEDCKELVPRWLRFVRGVIDSDDLPLNVSRELLQETRGARAIKKQVTRKVLAMLEEMASEAPEDYARFWGMYGRVLKEGLHADRTYAKQLAKLMRYASSTQEEETSLADYVERMPEGQPAIYYALGQSRKLLDGSPHLEALRKRGYEVLYMTDAIDEFAVIGIEEFADLKLVSVTGEDLDLDGEETEEEKAEREEKQKGLEGLTSRFTEVLSGRVREVRVSERLEESPVCLVIPEGGLSAHVERVLRANGQDVPGTKRILEVNPDHPLIGDLRELQEGGGAEEQVSEWIEMLYDQALLTEGSPIEDPASFARRVTSLLQGAARQAASS